MRIISAVLMGLGVGCFTAFGGTYYMPTNLSDQVLSFDIFYDPPATVLAPAGVYQGSGNDTVLELVGGNLVASDPTGGASGEYSSVAVLAGVPEVDTFVGGAILRATITGPTLEDVRDGNLPGLAVGLTLVDLEPNTYFFAAINRTTAGLDLFDDFSVANRNALTPGTGYFAFWELGLTASPAVIAAIPIPAGTLADTQLELVFSSAGLATCSVNGVALLTNHALQGLPDRAGIISMSWGTTTGNPAYSDVVFGEFRADGPEVPNGGGPIPAPAAGAVGLLATALLLASVGLFRYRSVGRGCRIDSGRA